MPSLTTDNQRSHAELLLDRHELRRQVLAIIAATPVIDLHTHLFPPVFGALSLSGIDELLTYHYLVAETFRSTRIAYERFWQMSKTEQADLIWQTLFVEQTPLSEATRGVITVLNAFGLEPRAPDLSEARAFFSSQNPAAHLDRVLALAGVSAVVMTNDPFDPQEARVWARASRPDSRFHAALRLDRLLNDWAQTAAKLSGLGYEVAVELSGATVSAVRRFLDEWIGRTRPLYLAASLPADFNYPTADARGQLIRQVVLPVARAHNLPFALMIGVRRQVNPALRLAGDGLGRADVSALERLCAEQPDVRFLATLLARENQHELCVAARKFNNLMPFGCWWFLNNPSIIAEVTRERLELLGTSFIPQHSDARILEQLIYKWQHSRRVIADALCEAYEQLLMSGRAVTRAEIERDVVRLCAGNFRAWTGLTTEPNAPQAALRSA